MVEKANINEILKEKIEFANDCEYFVRRMLDENEPVNQEIEDRRNDEMYGGSWSELQSSIYMFKENFFKFIEKSPFQHKITDYKDEAKRYLKTSFPFCFDINLRENPELWGDRFFGLELAFFAMSLGATDEQLKNIKQILQNKKMEGIDVEGQLMSASNPEKAKISVEDVAGSSVKAYQGNNLFETLLMMNDKNIGGFISYIMKSGYMLNTGKVFEGTSAYQDENGNIYVSEGNHRIITAKALNTIREHITGEKTEPTSFETTMMRIRKKGVHEIDRND